MKKEYLKLKENVILIDNYLFPRAIQEDGIVGKVYPINSTGIFMLSLCDGTNTMEEIVSLVARKYNIGENVVIKDTKEFLNEKIEQGIVETNENIVPIKVDLRGKEDIVLPYQLSIETTNRCQLKCKHCYNSSGQSRENELSTKEIVRILGEYRALGGVSVMLTGGEIFLKEDVNELVDYVATHFLRIVILTNGFGIKEDTFKKIKQHKDNVVLQISIDGLSGNHDYIRGLPGAFENTLNNIKRFVSDGVAVSIATTLNEKNVSDIFELTKIIKEIGCVSINIGAVSELGRAKENNLGKIDVVNDLPVIIDRLRKMYQSEDFQVGVDIEGFGDGGVNYRFSNDEYDNKCGAGYKILHIFANGKIGLCPTHGSIISKYWIGDLRKHTLDSILRFDNMKNILSIPTPTKSICGDCPSYDECAQCIVSMLNKNKQECIVKRTLIDEKIIDMQE